MNKHTNIILLFAALLISTNISAQHISITSNFEHGNIQLKERIGDSVIVVETSHSLKRDSIGDQYYWFYFKLDNLPDKALSIRFENMVGVYRGGPHIMYIKNPRLVYSYDQKNWLRMDAGKYDEENYIYEVKQKFESGPVWLAWAHPYTYTQSLKYMAQIANHPLVSLEKISESVEGRGIFLYNISKGGQASSSKESIVCMALQHPGEDAGAYFIEGFTNYLLQEKEAEHLLDKYNFLVIHIMNPDGQSSGNTRYNNNMADLNNIWNAPDLMQPEVKGVQEWLNEYTNEGHKITRFFDVHCWGQETEHLYLTNNDHEFSEKLNEYMHFAVFPSTSVGGATNYFLNTFGAKAGTVELSQKFNNSTILLTPDDHRKAGVAFLKALND